MTTELQNTQQELTSSTPVQTSPQSHQTSLFTEKVRQFFAPLYPLFQALITFFKTGIGILVGVLILLAVVLDFACGIGGHHKGPRPPQHFQSQEFSQLPPQRGRMQSAQQFQEPSFDRMQGMQEMQGMQRGMR